MDSPGRLRTGRNKANKRWLIVWLVLGAGLAGLLLFNSIQTYRFVSRKIEIDQVRAGLKKRAARIERELQIQHPESYEQAGVLIEKLQEEHEKLVWEEFRAPDGHVIIRSGLPMESPFSAKDIHDRLRNQEDIFATKQTPTGEVVIELFAIHMRLHQMPPLPPPGSSLSADTRGSSRPEGAGLPPGRPGGLPSFPMLEIAMSLADADATFWPLRRNLLIECSAALALLASTLIAAVRFRTYVQSQELEQQLQLARQVQKALLPPTTHVSDRAEVAAECIPAWHVGGDFYDMFLVNRDDLAVVLGDVSGKGVPAALLASLVHGAIRSSNWTASTQHHEQLARQLNQLLLERASGERYVTMFSCYYDHAAETLQYINAGHCPPLLVHKNELGSFDVSKLEEGGTVIGLLPEVRYKQGRVAISPGDVLVMFSDGIVESTNAADEYFGEDRLIAEIETNYAAAVEVIRQRVIDSVRRFAAGVPADDDLTFVIVRFSAEAPFSDELTALSAAI